jgi:hypothetical protein
MHGARAAMLPCVLYNVHMYTYIHDQISPDCGEDCRLAAKKPSADSAGHAKVGGLLAVKYLGIYCRCTVDGCQRIAGTGCCCHDQCLT